MKSLAINAVLGLLLAAAAVYLCDYAVLRFHIPPSRPQFGSVIVQRAYVIPTKDGKTTYAFDPPAPQECVNSLFPHYGDQPCWYLKRHTRQEINTGSR